MPSYKDSTRLDKSDEIRTLFGGVQGMDGGREEIGMGDWQEVTSVVYSRGVTDRVMTPVVGRGYGCERNYGMKH